MPVTASEALIDLALTEQAITDADAKRLRGHVVKTNADAPSVERLMVRHHQVPPERARALRQRVEAPAVAAAPDAPAASRPVADAPAAPAPGGDAPAVLIIYPAGSLDVAEPTAAQRAGASELGVDAGALVRDALPRLERAGTLAELRLLAARLRAAGIDSRAVPPPALAAPRTVQRARVDRSTLALSGPDGDVEIDLSKPTFVVVGRGDIRTRFVHVYAGGRAAPFEVNERTAFPGQLTQRDPFQAFLSAVQAVGGVSVCDLLLVHAAHVEQATVAVELPPLGPKNVASPRAIALSWVLYEAWLDGMSLDPATLQRAVIDKDKRASGRQERPERLERPERSPSGRVAPVIDISPSASAFDPPAAERPSERPSLSHVMRGGSMPEQLAAMTQKAPQAAPKSAAEAYLAMASEQVKKLGPQRLIIIGAVFVLLFLVYIFIQAGSGVRFHVKEDPAHGEAFKRQTIRVVVLGDNNLPVCVKFRVEVLQSKQVQAVAHQYVWQDDKEEPRNGGYDRVDDYEYLQQGDGALPCIFIYNAKKQIVTGVRGAGKMTPDEVVALLAAAAADPRSGKERRESAQ